MNADYVKIGSDYFSINHPKARAHAQSMAGMGSKVAQSDQRGQIEDRALVKVEESPHYRIAITVYRTRLLDGHDNRSNALKSLVDSITTGLGFKSDECPELSWEYFQCKTRGAVGTQILISRV